MSCVTRPYGLHHRLKFVIGLSEGADEGRGELLEAQRGVGVGGSIGLVGCRVSSVEGSDNGIQSGLINGRDERQYCRHDV